jgi:mannose-1-phosphate guanylyltransferase
MQVQPFSYERNKMITDVVIMAGGFGERLWPASCPANPKQFLALQNGLSFIQMSIKRALALGISGKIIIVTRRDIVTPCIEQSCMLKEQDDSAAEKIKNDLIILAEPCPKHTSAAIMSAVCLSKKFDKRKHTLLVLTSDHVIEPMSPLL